MTISKKSYDLFQGEKFIESMRSSGYKDTSYAVAELIDNAIDAHARHIEIICHERLNIASGRYSLDQIAVLDDGSGMTQSELRSALLFGDGTRGGHSKDIGKYGMGLPNSSLSQCKLVEVYSWQKSDNPFYSYIDVDKVKKGNTEVPIPQQTPIPNVWKDATSTFSKKSGTLVVWGKLDRCSWTTSKKLMEHSQFLIGRIYRRFLHRKNVLINLTTLRSDANKIILVDSKPMLPNDPMYLMSPSSTPGKWGKEPMFKKDVTYEEKHLIEYMGQKHEIIVRYSLEKDELRAPENVDRDQGSTPHGKHARKNTGVSILRSDREIMLDTNLVAGSDPRERWWGVEMDIPSSLDLVVDLTNNKQQTNALSDVMRTVGLFMDDITGEDKNAYELTEQDAARDQIRRMVIEVFSHIRSMQRRIRATRAGTRTTLKTTELDKKIDGGIRKDQSEGHRSLSDRDREEMKKDQRIDVITTKLEYEGKDKEQSKKIATQWVKSNKKIVFEPMELEGHNFFAVENTGGILRVKVNSNHRAYKNLLLLVDLEEYKDMKDKQRLELAKDGIGLLLASWARFEDLIENNDRRKYVQNIRYEWGKELDIFLEQNEI